MDGGIRQIYIKNPVVTKTRRKRKTKETTDTIPTKVQAHVIKGGQSQGQSQVQSQIKGGQSQVQAQIKGGQSQVQAHGLTNPSTWLSYPSNLVPPVIRPVGGMQPSPNTEIKNVKVELKKKTTPKRVHLNQKKTVLSKKQTKKVRKITLGISTFHKRITRAKKLHKKVKELSLDKLKEKLVKDGLIKSTSKAPESVLRQIASDSEVVSKRAL